MPCVISHRGLDPSRGKYFPESSQEAFEDHLARGFGIEFDPFLHDGSLIVAHDGDLSRITREGCHIISLADLLTLIQERLQTGVSALHLKYRLQSKVAELDLLLEHLAAIDTSRLIVFDTTIDTALYLKKKMPSLKLAPSVAHPYDIERYNTAVGGTLLSIEEALTHRELFDWVWLDEWDRANKNSSSKKFYTEETFASFRDAGIKIALVTPELHATSPTLLGGETHEDAGNIETLTARISEILALKPDAVCTDYPDAVRALIEHMSSKAN